MGKPHPLELRKRVVAFVREGNSRREAARHFQVSSRFVNNMMLLYRDTGSLAAKRQGYAPGKTKLAAHQSWLEQRLDENGDLNLMNCVPHWPNGVSMSIVRPLGDFSRE